LRRHQPRADQPDLAQWQRLGVRDADAPLRAALDEAERVHRGLRLAPGQEVCERFLFLAVSLLEAPLRGALDEVERAVGRRRGAVHGVVDLRARAPEHGLGLAPVRLRASKYQTVTCQPARVLERLV